MILPLRVLGRLSTTARITSYNVCYTKLLRTYKKGKMIYEGKAKKIYNTQDPNIVIQHFKDDATAFNAQKRGTIASKGIVNNRMSEVFFKLLEEHGVATHFVRRLSDRDMLIRACEIVKVEA